MDEATLAIIQTVIAVLGGGGALTYAGWAINKFRNRTYAKLVTDDEDDDIPEFIELYNQVIDECSRISPDEIVKFIGNHDLNCGRELCDLLFFCKKGEKLLGFLKAMYSEERRLLFIAYLGIDKSDDLARKEARKCLLSELNRFVRKNLSDCKGVLFEVELPEEPVQARRSKARVTLFRSTLKKLKFPCYQLIFQYVQPEIPSDCGTRKEEDTALFLMPLGYSLLANPLKLQRHIDKTELMQYLHFIYLVVYARVYSSDRELNKVYQEYLHDLYTSYHNSLPKEIPIS